jgi:hypothetical protein
MRVATRAPCSPQFSSVTTPIGSAGWRASRRNTPSKGVTVLSPFSLPAEWSPTTFVFRAPFAFSYSGPGDALEPSPESQAWFQRWSCSWSWPGGGRRRESSRCSAGSQRRVSRSTRSRTPSGRGHLRWPRHVARSADLSFSSSLPRKGSRLGPALVVARFQRVGDGLKSGGSAAVLGCDCVSYCDLSMWLQPS